MLFRRFMSATTNDHKENPKFLLDSKGYSCYKCRQRFAKSINPSEFNCPACERIGIMSPMVRSIHRCTDKENCRVHHVVERVKQIFSRNQQIIPTDNDIKSLNYYSSPPFMDRNRSTGPRKRALLIGITYSVKKYRLKGTINDVKNMRKWLIDDCQFHYQNILVLTDEDKRPEFIPTKKNIRKSLAWLVEDCREGDSLVFYFSGHGLRQPDFHKDEKDGYDETICPVDFMEEGMILDNEINATIVQPLPKGVTLHAIVDACHSGTILDLVHVYDRQEKKWVDNSPPNGSRKYTNGGLAISISACEDDQMAADTTAFGGKEMNGALTYILIELVKRHPGPTYGDLIDMIHETIDKINESGCLPIRMLRSMLHSKLYQTPLLSASEPFDVWRKHFKL